MPVMDGLTAIKLIRSEEKAGILRRSHVIALTGNARQQQIDDALSSGMDSGKPSLVVDDAVYKEAERRFDWQS